MELFYFNFSVSCRSWVGTCTVHNYRTLGTLCIKSDWWFCILAFRRVCTVHGHVACKVFRLHSRQHQCYDLSRPWEWIKIDCRVYGKFRHTKDITNLSSPISFEYSLYSEYLAKKVRYFCNIDFILFIQFYLADTECPGDHICSSLVGLVAQSEDQTTSVSARWHQKNAPTKNPMIWPYKYSSAAVMKSTSRSIYMVFTPWHLGHDVYWPTPMLMHGAWSTGG